jgi:DNA-binding NarL/FixJ family response regulator
MRAVLCTGRRLLGDVLDFLLTEAGLDVIDCASDRVALLASVALLCPDIVVLANGDPSTELGICNQLLKEYPQLKVVILAADDYAIADVGIRVRRFTGLSVESLRGLADSLMRK